MKSKYMFQIFVLLAMVVGMMGGGQPAYAQPAAEESDPDIIIREMTYWDASYIGYVDATRFEKWPFTFDADYDFTVTVEPTSGDLVPVIILQDIDGNELARGTGSLSSIQAAGSYFVQIQPEAGSGFYELMIRETVVVEPVEPPVVAAVSVVVSPEELIVGETAVGTVSFNEVPAEGYTSAEFTCTYPLDVVGEGNIVVTELFGTDAAVAISDLQDGTFIVAIAGSNGQKATVAGDVFTFDLAGLLAGEAVVECVARVSIGDSVLTDLPAASDSLVVAEEVVVVDGILAGEVMAIKAVTINLYDVDNVLAATVDANLDGTFSLVAPAGSYSVVAEASGYLKSQGLADITAGETVTMATISLAAGDIDANGVIDQFDAMTIGMSYNTALPDAADLNADGVINVLDLELLAANYNAVGPTLW